MAQNAETVILSVPDIFFVYKLKKALEGQDCKVDLAPDESEIFQFLHEEAADLLILDLEDPRKNPLVLIRTIREENGLKELPILAFTIPDRVREWEDRVREKRTIVVSTGFVSTYISNFTGLKAMFNA